MKIGELTKITKSIDTMDSSYEIELSMNNFINRDNYFGLISFEPDP